VIVEIDPREPESWLIGQAANVLRKGGVVVVPTDTVYGLACRIDMPNAIERIYALKKMDPKKPLAILVPDMQTVGRFAKAVSTPAFRVMKRVLPGPYTFIFEASAEVPKIMLRKRRTIGIRMPDHPVSRALLDELGEPLLSSSIRNPDDDFVNDPVEIDATHGSRIDLVIDSGPLLPIPSTVVDLSSGQPVLIRDGKGDVDLLEMFE
jgi:tRNA threonylcarbamoyl adenosine modification protein (Sua5/YciO/YrdC/YwlC family)